MADSLLLRKLKTQNKFLGKYAKFTALKNSVLTVVFNSHFTVSDFGTGFITMSSLPVDY